MSAMLIWLMACAAGKAGEFYTVVLHLTSVRKGMKMH